MKNQYFLVCEGEGEDTEFWLPLRGTTIDEAKRDAAQPLRTSQALHDDARRRRGLKPEPLRGGIYALQVVLSGRDLRPLEESNRTPA